MEIYLLRHGQSTSNELSLVCGATDFPLSERGLNQAKKICGTLSEIPFTKIYCSPLIRARQTIENLGQIDVSFHTELIELDTGDCSLIRTDELYAIDDRYKYQGLNPELKYPNGESLNDMLARVTTWFDSVKCEWGDKEKVLISGHEGTVCAILHHMLKISIEHYPTFAIGNCDFVHIKINDDGQVRYKFVPFNIV